jgi:thiol-disulfide isomerase/thioredoxin
MKVIICTGLLLLSNLAQAEVLQYFESKIDFWGEKKQSAMDADPKSQNSDVTVKNENGKFPWKTFLDPKNKEFFKEGDYTPPEPFMEIARNPSDENIKNWFEFMKKKNELAKNLDEKMRLYLAKNSLAPPPMTPEISNVSRVSVADENVKLDPSRFKVRMYFESTCPHCRKMFGVLQKLQSEGFQIEALQVDSGPVPEEERVVPIGKADPTEIKKHAINSVPYLLIADTKKKALLPAIQGYHDFQEIIGLLKSVSRN